MASSRKRRLLIYWLPVHLYAGLIFYLSSLPNPPLSDSPAFNIFPSIYFFTKRCHIHIIEYAVFSLLLARALRNSQKGVIFTHFRLAAILGAILYGLSDEIHQGFVPMREMSALDVLANSIGAIVGALLWRR